MEYSVGEYASRVKRLRKNFARQVQRLRTFLSQRYEIGAGGVRYWVRFRSVLICCAAPCSRGMARLANSSSRRLFGPDTETAIGVGAHGTLTAKQRTPSSCSSSSMA